MGFMKAAGAAMTTTNDFKAQNPNSEGMQQQYGTLVQNQANQNTLAQQLATQAAGGGPNPAQAQYQNNVNMAAQKQAGAIASAKGISPALQAQMASQEGAAAMQNAAGTGAALQAQQQIAAQSQQAGVLNNVGQEANQSYGTQQSGILATNNMNANISSQNAAAENASTMGLMNGISGAASKAATGGMAAHGGMMGDAIPMKAGGGVPGFARVAGDSPQNDTVHAMLSPGEIVVPRSIVHNPEKAKAFIEALNKKKGAPQHFGDVLKSKRMAAAK
jgi:hypothetical protein